MMITKSPQSQLYWNVGLFLPRMTWATWAASLPTGMPAASTTYHLRVMAPSLFVYVLFMSFIPDGASRGDATVEGDVPSLPAVPDGPRPKF